MSSPSLWRYYPRIRPFLWGLGLLLIIPSLWQQAWIEAVFKAMLVASLDMLGQRFYEEDAAK